MRIKLCGDMCVQISDLGSGITEGITFVHNRENKIFELKNFSFTLKIFYSWNRPNSN